MSEHPELPTGIGPAEALPPLDKLQMRTLVERIKELNCLYEISRLSVGPEPDINVILDRACEIMRLSWQYPDIARVRIDLDGAIYQSQGFRPTPWMQQAPLETGTESRGSIAVVYLEKRPPEDEGPFLKEERRLIDTVARELGNSLRVKLLEKARRESEERYATLIENAGDGVIIIQDGFVRFANRAFARMLGFADPVEITDRQFSSLIGSDLVTDPTTLFENAVFNAGSALQELVLHCMDGTPLAVEVATSAVPFRDGRADMAVIRDITLKRFLEQEIVSISERERANIGQELHDGICQYLAGIAAAGGALERDLSAIGREEVETARIIRRTAIEALEQTRAMARTLSPLTITPDGLVTGLRDLAYQVEKLFGLTCIVDCPDPILIDNATSASQLYRITQEAISNAVRHGRARTIRITLSRNADVVTLEVHDDGIGIDSSARNSGGTGLKIMNHRAHMIGALLRVDPHPSGGTMVRCTFKNRKSRPTGPVGV